MEQQIFAFSLIIEGTTEKVLQFIMPLESIYKKTLVSLNKKCIFEHYREFHARKPLLIGIILSIKLSVDLFRASPICLC